MPAKDQVVNGYTFVEPLGEGGQADVWLAEKRTSVCVTQFAVKVPRNHVGQVRKEIESWSKVSRLGHPNLLPLVEAFEENGQLYLVSEYVPKGTLKHWLESKPGSKAESVEQALVLIEGILAGVEVLHKDGLTHKDLKPANIAMLGELPRIMDYGLSRWQDGSLDQSIFAGTLEYTPPEGFQGERSHQWDVWSVGAILQLLLTGKCPFVRDENDRFGDELVSKIKQEPPVSLPDTVPSVVRAIVTKALQKDRKSRYRSAAEMRKAVLAAQNHLQTQREREERQRAELAEQMAKLALAEKETAEKNAAETIQKVQATLTSAETRERQATDREQQAQTKLSEAEDNMQTVAQLRLEAEKVKREAEQALEKSKADSDELQALREVKQTLESRITTKEAELHESKIALDNLTTKSKYQGAQIAELNQELQQARQQRGKSLSLPTFAGLFALVALGAIAGPITYITYRRSEQNKPETDPLGGLKLEDIRPLAKKMLRDKGIKAYDDENYEDAFRWLKLFADEGDRVACFTVAWMYENGEGTKQSYSQALRLYKKAIDQGDSSAMNNVGSLYNHGDGVTQDYAEAVKWYRKAAEAGNKIGMRNLGLMYENGDGVTKDLNVAKEWYRKAVKAGNDKAKENLKRLGEKV